MNINKKSSLDDSLLSIHLRILIIGLDGAGKTTFVKRIQTGKFSPSPSRTMGMNIDKVQIGNLELEIIDLGGQKSFRNAIWPSFLKKNHDLLLYVIDSADRVRLTETEKEFSQIIMTSNLKNTPICVLANKQDLKNSMSSGEIALKLRLADASSARTFQIIPTSMLTGEGLDDVIEWIEEFGRVQKLKEDYQD